MFEEDMIDENVRPTDEPADAQPDASSEGVAVSPDESLAQEKSSDEVDAAVVVDEAVSETEVEPSGESDSSEEASVESGVDESESVEPKPVDRKPLDPNDPDAGLVEEIVEESAQEIVMDWYILKVASNRENTIRDGLAKRVRLEGLEDYFGEVIVPTEKITEFKNGKKKVREVKLYPGYIVVQMALNDETWFLVRETPGIGDFTGAAGKPASMQPHEIERIRPKAEGEETEEPTLNIAFNVGDQVKVNDGNFENFEGEVDSIDLASGRVTVMINIFGRSTPVELEYWQIESV